MSLFRFVQWIREGRPVIAYSDGTQSRDFTGGYGQGGAVAGLAAAGRFGGGLARPVGWYQENRGWAMGDLRSRVAVRPGGYFRRTGRRDG